MEPKDQNSHSGCAKSSSSMKIMLCQRAP